MDRACFCTGRPVLSRTTREGGTTSLTGRAAAGRRREVGSRSASEAHGRPGHLLHVGGDGGEGRADQWDRGVSLKESREMSPGMDRPAEVRARTAPRAVSSLAVRKAVGRGPPRGGSRSRPLAVGLASIGVSTRRAGLAEAVALHLGDEAGPADLRGGLPPVAQAPGGADEAHPPVAQVQQIVHRQADAQVIVEHHRVEPGLVGGGVEKDQVGLSRRREATCSGGKRPMATDAACSRPRGGRSSSPRAPGGGQAYFWSRQARSTSSWR